MSQTRGAGRTGAAHVDPLRAPSVVLHHRRMNINDGITRRFV